MKSQGE